MAMEHRPDLIFLDINIPYLDGLQVCKAIRDQGLGSDVVIVSAHDDFQYARQAILCQVSNYLLKPFNKKELMQVLETSLIHVRTQRCTRLREWLYAPGPTHSPGSGGNPSTWIVAMIHKRSPEPELRALAEEMETLYHCQGGDCHFLLEHHRITLAFALESPQNTQGLEDFLEEFAVHEEITIALGSPNELVGESHGQARRTLENRAHATADWVMKYEDNWDKQGGTVFSQDDFMRMIGCLKNRDKKGAGELVEKCFALDGGNAISFHYVSSVLSGLVLSFAQYFGQNRLEVKKSLEESERVMNQIQYAEEHSQVVEILQNFLCPGENVLAVEVYKRTSAAWIEDQDFFRFSGIFREVYLYGKPLLHVEDLWLQPTLQQDNRGGSLQVELQLSQAQGTGRELLSSLEGVEVVCQVLDPLGVCLYLGSLALEWREGAAVTPVPLLFAQVAPWCHQHPNLYQVTLTIKHEGATVEVVPYAIGFRRITLEQGILTLNGERLLLKGVNRHEWNPRNGRAITPQDMVADLEVICRNNINAVRTSHYPNQTLWYHLCDQKGIYVMDETNLESHGSWQKMGVCDPSWVVPGSLPQWEGAVVDRAKSMFHRDKNHVSILFWSCGNESYGGTCIQAMTDFFHQVDPHRPVHYEGVFWCREFHGISDIESQMYTKPEDIRTFLQMNSEKPFILCEYMHNMGNSLGGMESYIRLQEEFPQYQGGFIWDFKDQALWRSHKGAEVLGYGGDFGERPTDYNFCGNGLLFADGKEKPAMEEVRYWYLSPQERQSWDQANATDREQARSLLQSMRSLALASPGTPLEFVEGDVNLGVKGQGFRMLFSKQYGGLVSLKYQGKEWLGTPIRPLFWRATTENDVGNDFSVSSGLWLGADCHPLWLGLHVVSASADQVIISSHYQISALPGVEVTLVHQVTPNGSLTLTLDYQGAKGAPQLPAFGLKFQTLAPCSQVHWVGLSGETYPDRHRGAKFGTYQSPPQVTPYLVPQECGCHWNTEEVELYTAHAQVPLQITALKTPFGFSALPCTALDLEQARHQEELPQGNTTTLSLFGGMRGVGGIDTWGADVEEAYHLSGEGNHRLQVMILGGGILQHEGDDSSS